MSTLRAKNRKPTHPGAILREDVLPSLGVTQTELADRLGVSRRTVSHILHEHRSLTPDMAIRLAHLLGSTPESWLNMQQALDVWELERKNSRIYEQIEKVA
jgi:addiction module HigA family antidote